MDGFKRLPILVSDTLIVQSFKNSISFDVRSTLLICFMW